MPVPELTIAPRPHPCPTSEPAVAPHPCPTLEPTSLDTVSEPTYVPTPVPSFGPYGPSGWPSCVCAGADVAAADALQAVQPSPAPSLDTKDYHRPAYLKFYA